MVRKEDRLESAIPITDELKAAGRNLGRGVALAQSASEIVIGGNMVIQGVSEIGIAAGGEVLSGGTATVPAAAVALDGTGKVIVGTDIAVHGTLVGVTTIELGVVMAENGKSGRNTSKTQTPGKGMIARASSRSKEFKEKVAKWKKLSATQKKLLPELDPYKQ